MNGRDQLIEQSIAIEQNETAAEGGRRKSIVWIMSLMGFYSIVKHRTEADTFMVRARVKGDLENLRAGLGLNQEVVATPHADYPFRLIVSGEEKQGIIALLGESIDYVNFKSAVGKIASQKAKLHAYHAVWADMQRVEEGRHDD